jgi:uncharacterized protein YjbI with pentapeptide repeats
MTGRHLDAATVKARATRPYVFGETVDLRGLRLTEPLDLSHCSLTNVDFSGTTFEGPVTCAGATFSGLAWFKGCTFKGNAVFSAGLFESDARFDGAVMHDVFKFDRVELRGVGAFDHAWFQGARFDDLIAMGNLSFAAAIFAADVSCRNMQCLGGLWLDGTRFAASPDFHGTDVHGRMWVRALQSGPIGAPSHQDGLVSYGYTYGQRSRD